MEVRIADICDSADDDLGCSCVTAARYLICPNAHLT